MIQEGMQHLRKQMSQLPKLPPVMAPPAPPAPPTSFVQNQTQVVNVNVHVVPWANILKDKVEGKRSAQAKVFGRDEFLAASETIKAKTLPPPLQKVPLPALRHSKMPTVKGDPNITTKWGTINYKDRAVFVLLQRDGLQGILLVDVYPPMNDFISDVWRYDVAGPAKGTWHHKHIPRGNNQISVQLDMTTRLPRSAGPSQATLHQFATGLTWLVLEGSVVPGPSPLDALSILQPDREDSSALRSFTAGHFEELVRRNYLGFELMETAFRGMLEQSPRHMFSRRSDNDHFRIVGANLLAGFLLAHQVKQLPKLP